MYAVQENTATSISSRSFKKNGVDITNSADVSFITPNLGSASQLFVECLIFNIGLDVGDEISISVTLGQRFSYAEAMLMY